jgi:hypothetical protein
LVAGCHRSYNILIRIYVSSSLKELNKLSIHLKIKLPALILITTLPSSIHSKTSSWSKNCINDSWDNKLLMKQHRYTPHYSIGADVKASLTSRCHTWTRIGR